MFLYVLIQQKHKFVLFCNALNTRDINNFNLHPIEQSR